MAAEKTDRCILFDETGKEVDTDVYKRQDLTPYGTVLEQHYVIDGGLYALPFRTNDWVIYYNKKIFDDAGVAYPTNDMTWEQFFELGKQLSHDDVYGLSLIHI